MSSIIYTVSENGANTSITASKNNRTIKRIMFFEEKNTALGLDKFSPSVLNNFINNTFGGEFGFDGIEVSKDDVVLIIEKSNKLGIQSETKTVKY